MPFRALAVYILLFFCSIAAYASTLDSLRSDYSNLSKTAKPSVSDLRTLGINFYTIYANNPSSADAGLALLYSGKSYKLAYENSKNTKDFDSSIKSFNLIIKNFKGDIDAEAKLESAEMFIIKKDLASAQFFLNNIINTYPESNQYYAAKAMLSDIELMVKNNPTSATSKPKPVTPAVVNITASGTPGSTISKNVTSVAKPVNTEATDNSATNTSGVTTIKSIRNYANKDYTRVVIDLSKNVEIEQHWLNKDPKSNLPPRLFIDIFDSAVDSSVPKEINIKDGLVKSIRWAYNKPGVTRVVLDSQNIKDFTVFQMENPARIVIDLSQSVNSKGAKNTRPATPPPAVNTRDRATSEDLTLTSAFGLKVRTIVIDAGHGGKDPGAVHNNIKEKDITLEIALELKELFSKHNKDIKVYLTRDKDVFIPLEERTAIANRLKADLFISIHINAARNKNAKGIETYVLNVTNDKAALEVAAFENQASTKSVSDLQGILKDIMLNSKLEESLLIAASVQNSLTSHLKVSKGENLGVKQAPFYVLVGARMPSILIESGFLSNKDDAKKLSTKAYRKNIALGIHSGVNNYIKKYNK